MHFSLVVALPILTDEMPELEDALSPFNECLTLPPYQFEYDMDIDETVKYARNHWQNNPKDSPPGYNSDPSTWQHSAFTPEVIALKFAQMDYPDAEYRDGKIYHTSTRNQNAKWDWWQLHGSGFFVVKNGTITQCGECENNCGCKCHKPNHSDVVQVKDIDFTTMTKKKEFIVPHAFLFNAEWMEDQ